MQVFSAKKHKKRNFFRRKRQPAAASLPVFSTDENASLQLQVFWTDEPIQLGIVWVLVKAT
ncbi:hypothetical protein HanXRQr2_Chr07g0291721 [Helianthus annuus]|uniref:Uncharacterized protein n=1 Tax=Helianthus annuus TaxID=4232 RepID=A0A251UAC6_HELAN|nr:hypothetical protein HanXRQr2_Chr07g0291721 [Helianthus annuus]KAJ0904461.1 hypothetical protein HanPSC8_Chr07g0282481 [Helianthus annuus]